MVDYWRICRSKDPKQENNHVGGNLPKNELIVLPICGNKNLDTTEAGI